ncbi:MAG: hypothetical protein M3361_05045 [Candidatus Tectomicrobia bacterium]|nr:hypothetical protein [Candidatus Tectomicrobia bacterium]
MPAFEVALPQNDDEPPTVNSYGADPRIQRSRLAASKTGWRGGWHVCPTILVR